MGRLLWSTNSFFCPTFQLFSYDGESAHGRQPIITKLQAVAQMHAGFKVIHEVVDVQCQPLGFVSIESFQSYWEGVHHSPVVLSCVAGR
jgi:hypothetical protein